MPLTRKAFHPRFHIYVAAWLWENEAPRGSVSSILASLALWSLTLALILGYLWNVGLFQNRKRPQTCFPDRHLSAVAQRVVLFHLQDYTVLGFLEFSDLLKRYWHKMEDFLCNEKM
jgi:hypothetical protein